MLAAAIVSIILVALTVVIHYEILRLTSDALPRLAIPPRLRSVIVMAIVIVIGTTFVAHRIEVWIYGLTYAVTAGPWGLGTRGGDFAGSFAEYIYFFTHTYTSLGLGDVWQLGPMRLIAGVEVLNGLILIGWTASFTFLTMQRFWGLLGAARDSILSRPPG